MASSNTTANKDKVSLKFSAIDLLHEQVIPKLTELKGNNGRIQYGENDLYPEYLYELCNDVTTLKTIIEGTTDFVCGDGVESKDPRFEKNREGVTLRKMFWNLAHDYLIYGGAAFEVILSNDLSSVVEVNYLNYRFLRSDKNNEMFWYSEQFAKKWGRTNDAIVYPRYFAGTRQPRSVVYLKNNDTTTYPIPRYSGAIKACEIERRIDDMHLNSLENNFMASSLISFNNGVPSDQEKAEIEKRIQKKFAGTENAGRIMISYTNGKENATTVTKLDTNDFLDRYNAAAERARKQIFMSFRATPNLFGYMDDTTGFNTQEFSEAFKLYNRTVCQPIQMLIKEALEETVGEEFVEIKPFNIDINNTTIE